MSQPELADGLHVGRLKAEDVAVFDAGLTVLLPNEMLVPAFEMAGLLSLRRSCAAGHRDQDGQADNDAAPYSSEPCHLLNDH